MKDKPPISFFDYIIHGIFFNTYGFFKYFPSPIGDVFRKIIFKLFAKKAGKVRIFEGVTMWYPYRISIGDRVTLNEFVYLNGFGGLRIDDDVLVGKGTTILTSNHSIETIHQTIRSQGLIAASVHIEEDVWIGANVTILAGTIIGRGAVLGAGCVVTKNVEPLSIMGGVPARLIRKREK